MKQTTDLSDRQFELLQQFVERNLVIGYRKIELKKNVKNSKKTILLARTGKINIPAFKRF